MGEINKTGMVLVLGLGESGLAMAQWLSRQGAQVRVADSRTTPPFAEALFRTAPTAQLVTGSFDFGLLEGVHTLALSPGLALSEPLVQEAIARGIRLIGEIELFAQALNQLGVRGDCKVIAITGTNGKTTVTSMVGALCRAAGKRTAVAGNISPAALSALMACLDANNLPEIWVLELSSFQLETTQHLNADAATVLNVTDDHMDRYDSLDEYAVAKARVFAGSGAQVLNRQDARVQAMAMAIEGRRQLSFGLDDTTGSPSTPTTPATSENFGLADGWLVCDGERLLRVADLAVSGLHNAANALAALALCRAIDLPLAPLLDALRRFKGLPHRVEKIADLDGVAWYDDSKGTNVGATVAALQGLGRKVVLIAGGDGKGQDFSPLAPALAGHARALVLIGRDAFKIEEAVAGCGVIVSHAQDMDQAVRKAAVAAHAGDAVLLSPACASFDMYRNYEHRAEVFATALRELAASRQKEAM